MSHHTMIAALLSVILIGYGDIVRAETAAKKTVPVASVPTSTLVKLSRPLNFGKVVFAQLDPTKTLAQQFREAWDKKYGVGKLDRKFKVTARLGGTTTVLTSPQSLSRWANRISATNANSSGYKVVFSPEVKLVLLREYGALALGVVDHQVDFNMAKYKDLAANQHALNFRSDAYKNLVDHGLMAKTAELLAQIDAMVDQFFAAATDRFGWEDIVAIASMLFGEETSESTTTSEGTGNSGGECNTVSCLENITMESKDVEGGGYYSTGSTLVRICCGCSGSGLGCLIGNNVAINKFADIFNSLHTDVAPLINTNLKLMLKK